ncbi:hypothetical protein WDU94_011117 [Cyamophila willieti]
MPPKSKSSIKMKVRNNKSFSSTLGGVKEKLKDFKNVMILTLNNLEPNMVQLNKEVICQASWMGIEQESSCKIKTSTDQFGESIINLNLDFMFNIETSFTPAYLTAIINNPILITLLDRSSGKSSRSGNKGTMDILGQYCWDILPLFTEQGQMASEHLEGPIEDQENTPRDEAAVETVPEKSKRSSISQFKSAQSIKKVKDSEIHAVLTLEPKEILYASDNVTPINKINLSVSAALYLDSSIPEELKSTNILSLIVESIYNLPQPLCEPEFEFKALRYSLGITLPLDMSRSMEELKFSSPNINPTGTHQSLSNPTLIFPNGYATTEPDKNFRAKWKNMEGMTRWTAKYSPHHVPGHTKDVKYAEKIQLEPEGKNHVQWNQLYRVWLTARMEHTLREHMKRYGMWPLEIKIDRSDRRSQSKLGLKKKDDKKQSKIDTKSSITATSPGPGRTRLKTNSLEVDLPVSLPIHQLALVELSDLIYPGVTHSRVLATFLPDTSAEVLKIKTGMDKFFFFNFGQSAKVIEPNTSKNSEKISEGDVVISDSTPADPFCIVVHIEFAKPLMEKPKEETILLELYDVTKTLCGPKPRRDVKKEVTEAFEKAIVLVSRIIQMEHENFMKFSEGLENVCTTTKKSTKTVYTKLHLDQLLNTGHNFQRVLHSAPQEKISIETKFKEHLMLSGVLAKAFTIFDRPMREYICFHYEPDRCSEFQDAEYTTLYSAEHLADIHAQVTGLISKIVERVVNSSPLQDSREGKCSKADILAKNFSYAVQYHEEGYVKDAERLLVFRIQTVQKSNSNNAQVWEDYGRFCLGEGRLEAAHDSLIRGLHLETRKETLMMLGYVSYRLKQWDKANLYFSALTNLFDTNVEAWTTLGIYFVSVGKQKEAVTVFHIAQMQVTQNESRGETDTSRVKSGLENNLKSEIKRNDASKLALSDFKTMFNSELSWMDPASYCFLGEAFSNTVLMKSCPLLLTLNMFEFAETCIREHILKFNKNSALAAYFYAVSQYKQGNFSAGLSHLHNISTPLSKCIPVLVLKFHHCASAMNAARAKLYNNTTEMKNVEHNPNLVCFSESNKENNKNCINGKLNKTKTNSKNPMGGLCKPSAGIQPKRSHSLNGSDSLKSIRADWNLTPSISECRQYYASMKWEVDSYNRLKWFVLTRLGRMSTEEEDKSEAPAKLLQEGEQYLLRVLQHQKTPLNWYFLGLVYLKQENLQYAEIAFTETNKLDPEFGDAWACLSLVHASTLASQHLQAGDIILKINNIECSTLSIRDIEYLIHGTAKAVDLLVWKNPKDMVKLIKKQETIFESQTESQDEDIQHHDIKDTKKLEQNISDKFNFKYPHQFLDLNKFQTQNSMLHIQQLRKMNEASLRKMKLDEINEKIVEETAQAFNNDRNRASRVSGQILRDNGKLFEGEIKSQKTNNDCQDSNKASKITTNVVYNNVKNIHTESNMERRQLRVTFLKSRWNAYGKQHSEENLHTTSSKPHIPRPNERLTDPRGVFFKKRYEECVLNSRNSSEGKQSPRFCSSGFNNSKKFWKEMEKNCPGEKNVSEYRSHFVKTPNQFDKESKTVERHEKKKVDQKFTKSQNLFGKELNKEQRETNIVENDFVKLQNQRRKEIGHETNTDFVKLQNQLNKKSHEEINEILTVEPKTKCFSPYENLVENELIRKNIHQGLQEVQEPPCIRKHIEYDRSKTPVGFYENKKPKLKVDISNKAIEKIQTFAQTKHEDRKLRSPVAENLEKIINSTPNRFTPSNERFEGTKNIPENTFRTITPQSTRSSGGFTPTSPFYYENLKASPIFMGMKVKVADGNDCKRCSICGEEPDYEEFEQHGDGTNENGQNVNSFLKIFNQVRNLKKITKNHPLDVAQADL